MKQLSELTVEDAKEILAAYYEKYMKTEEEPVEFVKIVPNVGIEYHQINYLMVNDLAGNEDNISAKYDQESGCFIDKLTITLLFEDTFVINQLHKKQYDVSMLLENIQDLSEQLLNAEICIFDTSGLLGELNEVLEQYVK